MFNFQKEGDTSAKLIVDKDGNPSERDLVIVTCVLLMEMAHADQRLSNKEIPALASIVARQFELADHEAGHILEVAELLRQEPEKVAEFLQVVRERFNHQQRVTLLAMLWRVMLADGTVTDIEARFAESVCQRLELSRDDVLAARELLDQSRV